MSALTLPQRLALGFVVVLSLAGGGVAAALGSAFAVSDALREVVRLAEDGRRLARVGALVREYYVHQAHLALGMDHAEHLGYSHDARAALDRAVTQLGPPSGPPRRMGPERLGPALAELDRLFRDEFLPARARGEAARATHIHLQTADRVQRLVGALEADERAIAGAITAARSHAEAGRTRAAAISLGALGVALVLAVGVATRVTRSITEPVGRLQRAAAEIARGEPESRVPEEGPPEVVALGRALNQMLGDLEGQRRARVEAETFATLGRVASGIAHEINNPLGVILGHARLLERAGGEVAEDAAVVAREARLCREIVRSLLDYARPGVPRPAPVDLGELARTVAERHEGCSIRVDPAPLITGDRHRLQQIVENLVLNGLAFGDRVELVVGATQRAGRPGVELTVNDDGPGVRAADRERVFEPFYSTRAEGTGLGLAIARSVAVAHGGTLSAHAGSGGRFVLWLPANARREEG